MAKARKGAALAAQEKSKQELMLTTFKGFDANWQCRGFQYAVGQTYKHGGGVEACAASGSYGTATASGAKSTACAPGRNGKAKAADGCALFLIYRDSDWNIVHAWAGIAGRDGIKPDMFYSLDESGKPVEA